MGKAALSENCPTVLPSSALGLASAISLGSEATVKRTHHGDRTDADQSREGAPQRAIVAADWRPTTRLARSDHAPPIGAPTPEFAADFEQSQGLVGSVDNLEYSTLDLARPAAHGVGPV